MKRWISIFTFALAIVSIALSAGCGGGSGTAPPTGSTSEGFYVITTYGAVGDQQPNPDVTFEGTSTEQQTNCSGESNCSYDTGLVTTNSNGAATVSTSDVPDYWGFQTYFNANCSSDNTYQPQEVLNQQTVTLECNGQSYTNVASPSTYIYGYGYPGPAPTSITITATNIEFTTSPLPVIDSYNESAGLEASIQATSVSSNQLSVTFPTNSTILTAGDHILVVTNSSGQAIGAAPFEVYYVEPPPPPSTGRCSHGVCSNVSTK